MLKFPLVQMTCLCGAFWLSLAGVSAGGQQVTGLPDSDGDGLSDALEQRLLEQFMPKFMIGVEDCSVRPAEFKPELVRPEVAAENGDNLWAGVSGTRRRE